MTDPWKKRIELHGGRAVCYLGDCLEILPTLTAGSVDCVVTDPPYGVGLEYNTYEDSPENWERLIMSIMPHIRRIAPFVVLPSCQIKRLEWWYLNFPPNGLSLGTRVRRGTSPPSDSTTGNRFACGVARRVRCTTTFRQDAATMLLDIHAPNPWRGPSGSARAEVKPVEPFWTLSWAAARRAWPPFNSAVSSSALRLTPATSISPADASRTPRWP